jgi:hypothetical protein
MFARSTFAVACVAAALACARVHAECVDPSAFGAPYSVETSSPGFAPHLEDHTLVVRVSGKGLTVADKCDTPPMEQFTLHWVMTDNDTAVVTLSREVPESCFALLETEETVSAEEFVEIRVPLPPDLQHGASGFSKMMLGIPPGGIYELYKIFDVSMLTRSASKWAPEEEEEEEFHADGADAAESAVDDAPIDGQATEAIETTTEEKTTLTTAKTGESAKHMPRKAAVEKLATA